MLAVLHNSLVLRASPPLVSPRGSPLYDSPLDELETDESVVFQSYPDQSKAHRNVGLFSAPW